MGFLWHSPSEGPLSHPFTIYTHRTSYRPNARGGPSSHFSQFLELCVATSKYLSTPVINYRGQKYSSHSWSALSRPTQLPHISRSCHILGLRLYTMCMLNYTDATYRKSFGMHCFVV